MAHDGAPVVQPAEQAERRVRREERADLLRWIAQARCLAATLDLLPHPIVLVTPGTPIAVWHANAAARRLLVASSVLEMRDGVLLPAGAWNDAALLDAMALALASETRAPERIDLAAPAGTATATVTVQALDFGASADLPVSQVLLLEVQERPGSAPPERRLQRLRDEFRLTPKEAECAVGLYALGSVDEFSRSAGKSIHTVRTQLKSAMQKTETRTQAGLVALVANLLQE